MGLGWQHILLIALAVLLLFGKGKISDLMGDVAKGIKSFKKGMADDDTTTANPAAAQGVKSIDAQPGMAVGEAQQTKVG